MSSKGFPLNDLPTEILLCILEMLHRGDLCSMCLVSRSLDATTAPLLYNALEWSDRALEFGIYSTNPSRLMSRGFDEDDGLYVRPYLLPRQGSLTTHIPNRSPVLHLSGALSYGIMFDH